jgi:thiamine-phosphate pyrophosphorylase
VRKAREKNVPTVADIARSLQARAGRRKTKRLPALLLFSDEARLPDPLAALDRLPRGAGIVFRHYGALARSALARALARRGRAFGIRVLVAGDARLAFAVRADGLHLPEAALGAPLAVGPRARRKSVIVTMAAHSLRAVFRASRLGADAAVLGPVFPTASHPGAVPIGPLRFARFCRKSPIPVYAIGGINPKTAPRLKDSGAAGIAGIGAILLPTGRGTRSMVRPAAPAARIKERAR